MKLQKEKFFDTLILIFPSSATILLTFLHRLEQYETNFAFQAEEFFSTKVCFLQMFSMPIIDSQEMLLKENNKLIYFSSFSIVQIFAIIYEMWFMVDWLVILKEGQSIS